MAVRELNDAELIVGARKGDSDAYGELYRRHVDSARAAARALTRSRSDADDVTSEAFARVLRALQSGGGPEVSFRPYLIVAVRNVFYDRVRRNREDPSEDLSDEVNVALLDSANSQEDGAFAAAAFATLPERWQLVLWHTEVEGRSVSEVAPLLGLAPNAVAALAYRAREGLRQAYLQAHLREQNTVECRECAENLGAYVRDGLSARDRRRIDAHLDTCASCTALVAELTDTNNTLRAALIPALLGVPAGMYLSGLGGSSLLTWLLRLPKVGQAAAGAGVAASVAVTVAITVAALGGGSEPSTAPTSNDPGIVATQPGGDGSNGSTDSSNSSVTTISATEPSTTSPDSTEPPTGTTTVTSGGSVPGQNPGTGPTTGTTTGNTSPTVPGTPTTGGPGTTIAPGTTAPGTTAPGTTLGPTTTLGPATTTTSPLPPPSLSASAVQRSTAVAGGEVRIEFLVSNTGASAVTGIRLDVPAPAGTTFVRAELAGSRRRLMALVTSFAPGWSCTGNVSCTLPELPAGESSTVMLTFSISPNAPATLTLTPAISAPAGADVTATPITVLVSSVPGLLAAETAHGSVVAIGNSVVTCADNSLFCADARQGGGPSVDHLTHVMQYVNTAKGTFNSSSAVLSLRGTVSKAYLVWGGDVQQGDNTPPNAAARGTVSFTTPSGTSSVGADRLVDNAGATFFAYADVTSLVSEGGTYSVADVQTATGLASFGGWSLVVIQHDEELPERLLMVVAPLDVVQVGSSSSFGIDLLHPMTAATGQLVAVAFEGDRSTVLDGDTVSLSGFSINNAFNGTIPGTRNPSYANNLGTDVLVAAARGMNGSRLSFSASSTNDRVMLALVAVALDV